MFLLIQLWGTTTTQFLKFYACLSFRRGSVVDRFYVILLISTLCFLRQIHTYVWHLNISWKALFDRDRACSWMRSRRHGFVRLDNRTFMLVHRGCMSQAALTEGRRIYMGERSNCISKIIPGVNDIWHSFDTAHPGNFNADVSKPCWLTNTNLWCWIQTSSIVYAKAVSS